MAGVKEKICQVRSEQMNANEPQPPSGKPVSALWRFLWPTRPNRQVINALVAQKLIVFQVFKQKGETQK